MTALKLAPTRTHSFRPGADDSPVPSPHTLDELGERIAELSARINVARREMLLLIAEFDRLDGWAGAGFSSCVDWLAWRTAITPTTARHQIRVAHAAARGARREGRTQWWRRRRRWRARRPVVPVAQNHAGRTDARMGQEAVRRCLRLRRCSRPSRVLR
ncbi:MAG: hypothetical protein F4Y07_17045 [Gemmatimonadetes bacterium]|nr:hypothetical protein [Gemmatimonadota bacterium]